LRFRYFSLASFSLTLLTSLCQPPLRIEVPYSTRRVLRWFDKPLGPFVIVPEVPWVSISIFRLQFGWYQVLDFFTVEGLYLAD
jgi:hypothetical protein